MTTSRLSIIFILIASQSLALSAQNSNSIFNGGESDGHTNVRQLANTNNSIFGGSAGDGHDIHKGLLTTANLIFNGGIADGHARSSHANPDNNGIFTGGSHDGFSNTRTSSLSNNRIFAGGAYDGHVVSKSIDDPSNGIFAGGIGDGHDREKIGFEPLPLPIRTIVYVDSTANGFNTGESWIHAFKEMRDGVQFSNSNSDVDTIVIAQGTYTPTATSSRDLGYFISNPVDIFGGFPSGGGTFGTRDPMSNQVRLSGDIGVQGEPTDNSYHVVLSPITGDSTLLDGLTIAHGYADSPGFNSIGAGVIGVDNIHLRDVILLDNYGQSEGSAIYIFNPTGDIRFSNVSLFPEVGSHPTQIRVVSGKATVSGFLNVGKN